jgi:RHS repeat-associated protein
MVGVKQVTATGTQLSVSYVYDMLNNRVEDDTWKPGTGTLTVKHAYDGLNIWSDVTTTNTLLARYVHGDSVDQVWARAVPAGLTNSGVAWYLTDRLGSVRDIVDNTGTIQDHIDYDGYGNPTHTTISVADQFGYAGGLYSYDTKMEQFGARWYDPATGRWVSEDPSGFGSGDQNLYRYCANGPTDGKDPSGLIAWDEKAKDPNADTFTMDLSVRFVWTNHHHQDDWTPARQERFSSLFKARVEAVWNDTDTIHGEHIRIVSTRRDFVSRPKGRCGREWRQREWSPRLRIHIVDDAAEADVTAQVDANPNGVDYRSHATFGGLGRSGIVMWLDEDDVNWTHTQIVAAHELGHVFSLPHPGVRGSPDEYLADPYALMGGGSEMRPEYYWLWAIRLDWLHPDKAPHKVVYSKVNVSLWSGASSTVISTWPSDD